MARTNRLIWLIIGAMATAFGIGCWVTGMSLDPRSAWKAAAAIACCLAISGLYQRFRPDPWIAFGARSIAQAAIILTLGVLLSYVAAASAFPYRDADLHAIDQWLGFNSLAYLRFYDQRPLLAGVISTAYTTIRLQTVLVVGALVAASQFERLQTYLIAVAVALAITVTVFVFVPAVDFYTFLQVSPKDYPNLSFAAVFDHIAPLAAARNGAGQPIDLTALQGLISFPSFHTTSAILFCWAALPLRWLRWFALAINVLMIAATPVDGGHYFIDLVGGTAVAFVAILLAGLLRGAYGAPVRSASRPQQMAPLSLLDSADRMQQPERACR